MQTWVSNIPWGRVGQPEEIVGPRCFLLRMLPHWSRVILPVDGGSRAMKNELRSRCARESGGATILPGTIKLAQIVQIGIVVRSIDQTTSAHIALRVGRSLSSGPTGQIRSMYRGTEEERLAYSRRSSKLGAVEVELIQPVEGEKTITGNF